MNNIQLQAGASRANITPPPNIAHGTWGAQKHQRAEGIDMDLYVTALAVSDGTTTSVVLDIDIQILITDLADRLRRAVSEAITLPIAAIRVSASHTHSGPTPYKSFITEGYELVPAWFDLIEQKCVEAAREALTGMHPAIMRAGRGECHINTNRRATGTDGRIILGKNPDGFSDHEVLVVRFLTRAEEPIATIVNYACHPTVMGPENRLITPDYPGETRRVVEEAVGGRCLFLLGAAGNQGPVQGFIAETAVYRRLGRILGYEAAKIALELDSVPVSITPSREIASGGTLGIYDDEFQSLPATPVQVRDIEIPVPLRDDIPDLAAAQSAAEAAHAALTAAQSAASQPGDAPNSDDISAAIVRARRADLKLRLAQDFEGRTTVGVRTHFLTIGDLALVACNIEPFAEIGAAIKQHSPFPFTLVSGYTNGRLAYMATAEEWPRGGHEVINSPFAPTAAEALQNQITQILTELRTAPSPS